MQVIPPWYGIGNGTLAETSESPPRFGRRLWRNRLVEPSPAGFKPLASAVILEPGDNWAPLALVDGKLLVRGQKELKALQVAQ